MGMGERHSEIAKAAREPEDVRVWALAHAAVMVLVDDPRMDPIFARLTGPERMALGPAVVRATLQALVALNEASDHD